jgi:transcriptional regulator with XRE-family HTH domain
MPRRNPPTGDPILDELRRARESRGLSLQAVGQAMGRGTYQTVWNWESGTNSPTLPCLREWCAALGYALTITRVSTEEATDRG